VFGELVGEEEARLLVGGEGEDVQAQMNEKS